MYALWWCKTTPYYSQLFRKWRSFYWSISCSLCSDTISQVEYFLLVIFLFYLSFKLAYGIFILRDISFLWPWLRICSPVSYWYFWKKFAMIVGYVQYVGCYVGTLPDWKVHFRAHLLVIIRRDKCLYRFAKQMMDDKNFFGGILHVCYAPELESLSETRQKLTQRETDVLKRIRRQSQKWVLHVQ